MNGIDHCCSKVKVKERILYKGEREDFVNMQLAALNVFANGNAFYAFILIYLL